MLVQSTLRWIILAKEPLKTKQLREALSIEDGSTTIDRDGLPDEEVILDLCSSLIRKSINGDRLELSHFTVEEYLKSTRISSNSSLARYHIDPETATLELSKKCMVYLNMEDFCQDLPSTKKIWQERHDTYPFRMHAVKHWHEYATDYANHLENDFFFSLCQKLFDPNESLNFYSYAQDTYLVSEAYLDSDATMDSSHLHVSRHTPLHYAAIYHLVRLQQWLLSCDCDVNNVGTLGSPLHCALIGIATFELFDFETQYLLGGVISSEQLKSIALLLHAGADWSIPLRDNDNQSRSTVVTILTFVGTEEEDKVSLLKIFLDAGAVLGKNDIEELEIYYRDNKHEFGTFFELVQRHHIQEDSIARFLDLASIMKSSAPFNWLEINSDAVTKSNLINRNESGARLRWAARVNQTDKMACVLRDPVLDINSATEDTKKTALHIALSNGSIGAVKLLLDAGADVNQPDCDGNTALHEYTCSGIKDPIFGILLVLKGGIIGCKNKNGQTTLDLAAKRNNVLVLRALLTLNEQEEGTLFASACSRSALRYAVEHRSLDATVLLVDYVEDLNYPVVEGRTLAHYCWNSSTAICRLLIERGLDVEAMTEAGESALHLFISRGSPNENKCDGVTMIRLLATAATINLQDSDGMTPAARLCSRDDFILARTVLAWFGELLKHGADITRVDSSSKAPLDILISRKRVTFTLALIERIVQHVHHAGVIIREDLWSKVSTWALENRAWNLATKISTYQFIKSQKKKIVWLIKRRRPFRQRKYAEQASKNP